MSTPSENETAAQSKQDWEWMRVYWAAERTHLAWIRTGVAMMGFGFIVARFGLFLREMAILENVAQQEHPLLSLWIGAALIGVGVLIHGVSAVNHFWFLRSFDKRRRGLSPLLTLGIVISLVLVVLGIMMGSYLFVLNR